MEAVTEKKSDGKAAEDGDGSSKGDLAGTNSSNGASGAGSNGSNGGVTNSGMYYDVQNALLSIFLLKYLR